MLTKFRKIIFVQIFFLALLASWALSSPIGSSPDDDFHIGSIWCANGQNSTECEILDDTSEVGIASVAIPAKFNICFAFQPDKSGECKASDIGWTTTRANIDLYPSLYYKIQHLFVSEDWAKSILSIRLFNALIASVLFGFALYLSGKDLKGPALASWTFSLVPLGFFLVPSINPSSWAYIGIATNWVFQIIAMKRRSTTSSSRLPWLLYYFSAFLCIASRSDAAVYVAVSGILVYLLASDKPIRINRSATLPPVIVLAASALSVLITEQGRNFGLTQGGYSNQPFIERVFYNLIHLIEYPAGALGLTWGLGWLDTPIPPFVSIVGISLLAILLFGSWVDAPKTKILVVVSLLLFVATMLIYVLNQGGFVVGEVVQPRYILPLIPLLIGLSTYLSKEPANMMKAGMRRQMIISMLVTANAMSLYTNIRRYVTGTDEIWTLSLNRNIEWWWPNFVASPNLVFAVGTLAFVGYLVLAWDMVYPKTPEPVLSRSEKADSK
jgi:hypothetical protein